MDHFGSNLDTKAQSLDLFSLIYNWKFQQTRLDNSYARANPGVASLTSLQPMGQS